MSYRQKGLWNKKLISIGQPKLHSRCAKNRWCPVDRERVAEQMFVWVWQNYTAVVACNKTVNSMCINYSAAATQTVACKNIGASWSCTIVSSKQKTSTKLLLKNSHFKIIVYKKIHTPTPHLPKDWQTWNSQQQNKLIMIMMKKKDSDLFFSFLWVPVEAEK